MHPGLSMHTLCAHTDTRFFFLRSFIMFMVTTGQAAHKTEHHQCTGDGEQKYIPTVEHREVHRQDLKESSPAIVKIREE